MTQLNQQQWLRYSRHYNVAQFGIHGQQQLHRARVAIVGLGGLGAPVSLYLTAAGVGHLTLIDDDIVELSNLQRQVIFREQDIGSAKVTSAATHLRHLNSDIDINFIKQRLSVHNAMNHLAGFDIVVDCSDNFATRYLINEVCHHLSSAWCYASIAQYQGQMALFKPGAACFRCVFPSVDNHAVNCRDGGVLGAVPGVMGSLQASQVIQYLSDPEQYESNRLLSFDTRSLTSSTIRLQPSKFCATCQTQTQGVEFKVQQSADNQKPRSEREPAKSTLDGYEIDPKMLDEMLRQSTVTLIDVRNRQEHQAYNIGGRLIPETEIIHFSPTFDSPSTIVLYCQSGARSTRAAVQLRQRGIAAYSLAGGLQAYCAYQLALA